MNDLDLASLTQRLTDYLGVEPYLARMFLPGELEVARVLVILSFVTWALVPLSVLGAEPLKRLQRPPAPEVRRKMLEAGQRLQRVGRRLGRVGFITLVIGVLAALPLLLVGIKYAWESFALGAVLHLGLMLPARIIMAIYGQAFEALAVSGK